MSGDASTFSWILTILSVFWPAIVVLGLLPGFWWRTHAPPTRADDDLDARLPVWSALSELYLDTELVETDRAFIVGVLDDSPYTLEQIEEILYCEVHPVLIVNLLSVAGEWTGFDSDALAGEISSRCRRPRFAAFVLGQWMVRGEWKRLAGRLQARRRSSELRPDR